MHDLGVCTECAIDSLGGRHWISECPKVPTYQILPEHPIDQCTKCVTKSDLRRHTIQQCDNTAYQGPGSGHPLGQDDTTQVTLATEEHPLREDSSALVYGLYERHELSGDPVQTIGKTVDHDLEVCETCALEHAAETHRLSECPNRQSTLPIDAPVPIHDQSISRRFSHWDPSAHRRTDSSLTEQFFDADSDKADTVKDWNSTDVEPIKGPSRTQSISSLLDYNRATQWLRGLLNYAESTPERFTSFPSGDPLPLSASNEDKLPESVSEQEGRLRSSTGQSTQPSLKDSKVDSFQFRRAVSDLERLLNEAVTLAARVTVTSETVPQQLYKEPSISLHSHCHSLSPVEDSTSSGGTTVALESTEKTARIPMKHASTYPGPVGRPKRQSIVKNYSGSRDYAAETPGLTATQASRHIAFEVPARQSSKRLVKRITPHASALPFLTVSDVEVSRSEAPATKKVAKGSEDIVDFQDYFSHHRDLATAHDPLEKDAHSRRKSEVHQHAGQDIPAQPMHGEHGISLRHRSHISLPGTQGFSLAKSHKRQPIARDWSPLRKRFVATVACLSTALIGAILGIYAGIVPSIQYYIIDDPRVVVHGNTGCFLGLAIPTFLCWPLPLLHGRKPYILGSMVLAMPLLFPQAIAVSTQRLENTGPWRAMLLVSRALIGASLGFASMNFHSILTDLFGASLMSTNPHQEVADICDARRHGGGMGVWLGIWTWCWIGSLGIGFLIGAILIDHFPPVWGFYVSIMFVAAVLLLNVICPEVRRSAFRRSIAEVRSGEDISRRLARGEVMMHRVKTGPKWWGEEMYHGVLLCGEMLRQPGFLIVAIYSGWIYAQVVLIILLLSSLASNLYRFYATGVGLLVACLSLGALLAVPFQKANLFSRSRQAQLDTNRATLENKVAWTSHLVRRVIFTTMLPICGLCYACLSYGPPLTIAAPTIFATSVGFLSCLAISECNGLIMETFDTSDLSPGMTGRPKNSEHRHNKRTNYSSFPRVTAGFALVHTFAFVLAAGATALAGSVTRNLGQQVASGVVAGILFLFTVVLLLGLARFKEVQIVPNSKAKDMDRLSEVRRKSTLRRASMPDDPQAVMEEENAWRPVMIGNPISKMRRMNIFELGSLTRWQEIRKKNKLIDEGAHVNRAALGDGLDALDDQFADLRMGAQDLLLIGSTRSRASRRPGRSDRSSDPSQPGVELDDLDHEAREPGQAKARLAGQAVLSTQVVSEETEEEINAVRRRSISQGKQPAV
ncbi:Major facilitator superfamily transporter [Sarocladium implicatum]|nr:Major facilitator superfamily transporter [Sarocladium implicatum]